MAPNTHDSQRGVNVEAQDDNTAKRSCRAFHIVGISHVEGDSQNCKWVPLAYTKAAATYLTCFPIAAGYLLEHMQVIQALFAFWLGQRTLSSVMCWGCRVLDLHAHLLKLPQASSANYGQYVSLMFRTSNLAVPYIHLYLMPSTVICTQVHTYCCKFRHRVQLTNELATNDEAHGINSISFT